MMHQATLTLTAHQQDGQPKCKCQDPLQPVGRDHLKYWHRAHEINIEAAAVNEGEIDVLFLGDSITEGWKGTSYGRSSARTQDVPKVFHKYFSKDSGKYEGLALGISGDTVSRQECQVRLVRTVYSH